jgi:hypothetical protein
MNEKEISEFVDEHINDDFMDEMRTFILENLDRKWKQIRFDCLGNPDAENQFYSHAWTRIYETL